jgi:hypothetical protein
VHGFDCDGFFVDNSVETVVGVSGVLYSTFGAVRIYKGVGTLDDISTARLLVGLDVSGVGIIDAVSEVVVSWGIVFGDYGFSDGSGVSYWGYGSGDRGGVGDGRGSGVMDGRGSGVRDSRSGGVRHGRGCVGDCRGGVGDCGGGGVAQGGARTGHCDQSGEGDELKEEKDYEKRIPVLVTDALLGHTAWALTLNAMLFTGGLCFECALIEASINFYTKFGEGVVHFHWCVTLARKRYSRKTSWLRAFFSETILPEKCIN